MTAYATLAQFKARTDRDDVLTEAWETAIEQILDTMSRKIDNICKVPNDYFVAASATRNFSADGKNYLKIPECTAIASVSVKVDYDDTVYVLWNSPTAMYAGDGDWYAIAGHPNKPLFNETPYTYLVIDPNGDYSYFPRGHNFWNIQMVADFGGYVAAPDDIRELCLAETVVLVKQFQGAMDSNVTNTDLGQLVYRIRMSELSRNARDFLLAGGWIPTMYSGKV